MTFPAFASSVCLACSLLNKKSVVTHNCGQIHSRFWGAFFSMVSELSPSAAVLCASHRGTWLIFQSISRRAAFVLQVHPYGLLLHPGHSIQMLGVLKKHIMLGFFFTDLCDIAEQLLPHVITDTCIKLDRITFYCFKEENNNCCS